MKVEQPVTETGTKLFGELGGRKLAKHPDTPANDLIVASTALARVHMGLEGTRPLRAVVVVGVPLEEFRAVHHALSPLTASF
jgi:hypothetical protein